MLDEPLGSTLPSGGESVDAAPPDPAQARADIVAAFAAVYDPNSGVDVRLRLIDDATGVAAAMRQAEAGPNAAALTSVTVNVNDVQYLSATRARAVYSLSVPGQPPVLGRGTGSRRLGSVEGDPSDGVRRPRRHRQRLQLRAALTRPSSSATPRFRGKLFPGVAITTRELVALGDPPSARDRDGLWFLGGDRGAVAELASAVVPEARRVVSTTQVCRS